MDRNKCTPNQSGKAIENHIQITPIVDSNKPMAGGATAATITTSAAPTAIVTSTPTQLPATVMGITASQPQITPSINNLNSNSAITMNVQPTNQQILNIPNNVQIISSSSSSNNLTTHGNIITNSISSNQPNNIGGVLINTSQSYHPQISLQRSTNSSSIQTITNQGALISTSAAHLPQSSPNQPRQIQMTMQPTPNIQMQMLPTTSMQPEPSQISALLSQLTGSLTLSFSEDGRWLLKHNANAPQDSQSQMILQAIQSGVLCNVLLINETTTPSQPPPSSQPPNVQQPNMIGSNKSSIILKTNDAVPKPNISTSNTMVINTNIERPPQQSPSPMVRMHTSRKKHPKQCVS